MCYYEIQILGKFQSWPNGTDCKSVSLAFSGSNPLSSTILNLIKKLFMRMWLSGRASPCQGEGREFESRLALFQRVSFGCSLFLFNFFVRIFWGNDTLLHCIL